MTPPAAMISAESPARKPPLKTRPRHSVPSLSPYGIDSSGLEQFGLRRSVTAARTTAIPTMRASPGPQHAHYEAPKTAPHITRKHSPQGAPQWATSPAYRTRTVFPPTLVSYRVTDYNTPVNYHPPIAPTVQRQTAYSRIYPSAMPAQAVQGAAHHAWQAQRFTSSSNNRLPVQYQYPADHTVRPTSVYRSLADQASMCTSVPGTAFWRGAAPSTAPRPDLRASAAPPVVRTTLPAPQAVFRQQPAYRPSQQHAYRTSQPRTDREVLYSRLPQITPAGLGSVHPRPNRTTETFQTTSPSYARNSESRVFPTYRPSVVRGQHQGGARSLATSSATSAGSGSYTKLAPEPRTYQRRREAPSTWQTTTHRTHTTQPASAAHTRGGITWVRLPADARTGVEVAKPLRIIRAPPPNVVRLPRHDEHLSRHTPQRGRLAWFPEDYTPTHGKDVAASRDTAVTECSFA